MLGKGGAWPRRSQNGGGLPIVTNSGDQTKNQVILHVESPTKPYRNPCSRCETLWQIRIGLPTLTNRPFWLAHHSMTLLPTLTSRGVKYTHDHKHSILHSNRGPLGLCVIPQASDQKKVVVGDGGAKHRYIDTPTEWHSVPDPHAVATIPQGGPPGLDPTLCSFWAYGLIIVIEAT